MTLQEIIIKIMLFFALFYGAIAITSIISKIIKKSNKDKE